MSRIRGNTREDVTHQWKPKIRWSTTSFYDTYWKNIPIETGRKAKVYRDRRAFFFQGHSRIYVLRSKNLWRTHHPRQILLLHSNWEHQLNHDSWTSLSQTWIEYDSRTSPFANLNFPDLTCTDLSVSFMKWETCYVTNVANKICLELPASTRYPRPQKRKILLLPHTSSLSLSNTSLLDAVGCPLLDFFF